MSLINVSNLTFGYNGSVDNIFEDVSFQLDTNWRLGFTGRNGRGKTTFLRLLLGDLEYRGSITSNVIFHYFPYDVPDMAADTLSVLQAIAPDAPHWALVKELSRLALDESVLYRPFETLSNGERTKALLAALFLNENGFLLIDEPTNHLDAAARTLVADYLRTKNGFILVSHDRTFMDACVDHILAINRMNIEVQHGNFSTWQTNKERQDTFELAENAKLKKDIKRLNEAAKRTAKWSDDVEKSKIGGHAGDRGFIGHKSAKMMKRSKAIESRRMNAAEEKSQLLRNLDTADSLKLSPLVYHSERLASLDGVTICYGNHTACENISLTIRQGQRIALQGRNGSGKSSILKLFAGLDMDFTGHFWRGSGLQISYVSQDTSFLTGSLSDYAQECNIDESLFKAILRKLDFARAQFDKDMRDFSEGQKKKTLLARSLCERAHLYIWDEPLNFIDVLSRMQIEELILAHSPTLLFVEHDAAFTKVIATSSVILG